MPGHKRPLRNANQVELCAVKIRISSHGLTSSVSVAVHIVENGFELGPKSLVIQRIHLDTLGVSSSNCGNVLSQQTAVFLVLAVAHEPMKDNRRRAQWLL